MKSGLFLLAIISAICSLPLKRSISIHIIQPTALVPFIYQPIFFLIHQISPYIFNDPHPFMNLCDTMTFHFSTE